MSTYNLNAINAIQQNPQGLQVGAGKSQIVLTTDGRLFCNGESISAEELIQIALLMKQLILDISQDDELASKYPYIREASHSWLIKSLKE